MSVILVTGASGTLGSAVVRVLSAGNRVVGVARRRPEFPDALAADLTRAGDAQRVVAEVTAKFGALDSVVHVLGGFAGGEPVQGTSEEIVERMLDMNYRSAFHVFRAAVPHVIKAGKKGRIVAVGSRVAVEPVPALAAYSASKAALLSLMKTLSLELRESGVTVNAVLPSMIDTPENRASDPSADFSKWVKPESIAAVIKHLLSDDARDISGAAIPVYGDA
jgi:NAD(P)-dependent dehydrogenase (short-subunit alcohol dehydrogenase family)